MTLQLLLAEDDPQLREVLIEALTLESFAVTACDNAEDALDIAAKQPFDLALFDVVMGGMTGIDALTTLRRLQPNIGIIITTAFATVDIAVDAMKKGADEFLTKPFNLAALSVTLKRVHAEHAPKADIAESEHDQIFSALSNPFEPAPTPPEPAVPVRSSIKADYIVDLIDGTKHKMLKRHLQTAHGLTPAEYRAMFNLPADYPMVAPNYSETRRRLAKEIGLGRVGNPRRGRRSTEARGRVAAAH